MEDSHKEYTGLKGLIFGSTVTLNILKDYMQNADEVKLAAAFPSLIGCEYIHSCKKS